MKKSLIAIAALAAAGGAFAQSSVTLYGQLGGGIVGATGALIGALGANGKAQLSDSGGIDGTGSRFGLRGTEDLGNGLKVNFVLENGFSIGNGAFNGYGLNNQSTGAAPNSPNLIPAAGASVGFDRQAWLGLATGFGEIRAGRQYTINFLTSGAYVPATGASALLNTGLATIGAGVRESGAVQYWSPNFSGFQVAVSHQLQNNLGKNNNLTELGASYINGPLAVRAALGNIAGNNGFQINGGYDFGGFTLNAGYYDVIGKGPGKGFSLGATAAFGDVTPWINFARNTDTKVTGIDLGARYALSKRTSLYGVFANVSDKAKGSKWGFGVNHAF